MSQAAPDIVAFDPTDRVAWSALVPSASLSDCIDLGAVPRRVPTTRESERRIAALRSDGFFSIDALLPRARCERMREIVERVRHVGRHEVFALLWDDFWTALAGASRLVEDVLGARLRAVPVPYVNYVPAGAAGFGAHRDRYSQPLGEDGLPEAVTIWTALTDATPERACLAMLPTRFDPGFPDDLHQHRIADIRDVRAVPLMAGSSVCFNLAVLHWGTRNVSAEPRVSFAFELGRPNAVPSALPSVDLHQPLTFAERARFLGAVVSLLKENRVTFNEPDLAYAKAMEKAASE